MTKLVKTFTAGILALGLAVPAMTFAADTAADTFKSKCAMCHGENGAGKGKVPALTGAATQGKSDADLKGVIEKGTKTANGMMPPYGTKLPADQVDELVKYIRSLKK
jgi:mono/diheme cytochrome c family protein